MSHPHKGNYSCSRVPVTEANAPGSERETEIKCVNESRCNIGQVTGSNLSLPGRDGGDYDMRLVT